jgi:hypothetical protein
MRRARVDPPDAGGTRKDPFHRSIKMEQPMERSSHSKKDPVFHCYMRTRGYCPVNGMV